MEKILITGGAGYLGSVITNLLLKKGYAVTVYDSLLFKQNSLNNCCVYENFDFIHGDINDHAKVKNLIKSNDIIIPLAAIVGAPACDQNKDLTKQVNYDAQINISKNTSKNQLIIYPNTNSGYGVGDKNEFCDEETPLNPISLYGKLKVEIEKYFIDNNNAVTLRLATVFGVSPRMRTDLLVNDFVLKSVKDGYLILFEQNFRRNYIHIQDVAKTFLFAINNFNLMKNNSYNVGLSSANLTKRELAETIKKHIPSLYIHSSNIKEDPDKRDYIVSNKKLENLGWIPDFSLDDGIKELIKCYKFLEIHRNKNI